MHIPRRKVASVESILEMLEKAAKRNNSENKCKESTSNQFQKLEKSVEDLLKINAQTQQAGELLSQAEDKSVSKDNTENQLSAIRLPKLETSPFDGNVMHFQEFWDLFTTALHTNKICQMPKNWLIWRTVLCARLGKFCRHFPSCPLHISRSDAPIVP